jgi:acyl dehydratase
VRVWNFNLPVFVGDTIRCTSRVVEKTLRGRGKRGEVVWYRGISNQVGKTVQEGELVLLIEARPLIKASEANAIPSPNGTME